MEWCNVFCMQSTDFTYKRAKFSSHALGRDVQYGTVQFKGTETPRETLYFFHGGNGDDHQLIETGALEQLAPETLSALRARRAQIILPYVGASFLRGAFKTHFYEELIPHIEKTPQTRHVSGLSMGGQAALTAFLERPDFFASGSAHFPTLIAFDFTREAEVKAYLERTGVQDGYLQVLLGEFKREFGTREELSISDPIRLAEKIDPSRMAGKKIFFDVGSKDFFGLSEGCSRLHEVLLKRGIAHEYACVPEGSHDGPFVSARFGALLSSVFG